MKSRVHVMHGVNLDLLGTRDPAHYGSMTLLQLETRMGSWARALELDATFFQSNHEGEFVEELHRLVDLADAAILNPGAWTHYSWAIRDALEPAGVPAVEVHLSDVQAREEWRRVSVLEGLVTATVSGQGIEGYHEALRIVASEIGAGEARGGETRDPEALDPEPGT